MGKPDNRVDPVRRRFLIRAAAQACGAGLLGMGLITFSRQAHTLPASAIRPPGALAEQDFLSACVRCGLCVRDCPYKTLRLSELGVQPLTGLDTPLRSCATHRYTKGRSRLTIPSALA